MCVVFGGHPVYISAVTRLMTINIKDVCGIVDRWLSRLYDECLVLIFWTSPTGVWRWRLQSLIRTFAQDGGKWTLPQPSPCRCRHCGELPGHSRGTARPQWPHSPSRLSRTGNRPSPRPMSPPHLRPSGTTFQIIAILSEKEKPRILSTWRRNYWCYEVFLVVARRGDGTWRATRMLANAWPYVSCRCTATRSTGTTAITASSIRTTVPAFTEPLQPPSAPKLFFMFPVQVWIGP